MKKTLLVAKETYLRQVKSIAFLIMVLSPFIMLFISVGIGMLSGSSAENRFKLAVVFEEPLQKEDFSALTGTNFDYKDEAEAEKALKDEQIGSYLMVQVKNQQVEATYHSDSALSEDKKAQLMQSLMTIQNRLNVATANLTNEQMTALSRQPKITEAIKQGNQDDFAKAGKMISLMVLNFIMYFIIALYASSTAQEIASEKGTKIMEVIFSSVPASNYFYGRILGIFGVIVTHIGLYVIGGAAAYKGFEHSEMIQGIKPMVDSVLQNLDWTLVGFAILGILVYVVLAALCGSIVVRAEDANKAAQPVVFLLLAAFFGATALGQQGADNIIIKVGSYVPFFSSFFMPIRTINGYASTLESVISLLILAAVTVLFIRYIGKSYAGLILQTDDIGFLKSLKRGLGNK